MRTILLSGSLLLACAVAAPADVISVNFTGNNDASALDPAEQAGNPDVAGAFTANWNNVGGASGSNIALINSDGDGTGVVLSYNSPLGGWAIPSTAGGTNLAGGANPKMMKGYLDADGRGATVSLTGLSQSFKAYRVLIYFDGDNGGAWRVGNYKITNTADSSVLFDDSGEDSEYVDFNSGAGQNANGVFQIPLPGTGGNQAFPISPNNDEGNFFITGELTADSILLTATGLGSGTLRAPINGIQIIAVPEPGLLSLAGIACVAMLKRRRR